MIPRTAVTAWATQHPWQTREQVEQDLLLSRAICAIAADPYLGHELVFRGGTAFHKLHLREPRRYSEDLDYVRTSASGIATLTRALTGLGESLGFDVRTRVGTHPKVYWRTTAETGVPLRLKVEVNTHERSPALSLITIKHGIDSSWWTGTANVLSFQPSELVATKIRALYQRKKGRDLFDLWLALTELQLDPAEILAAFAPYRPERFSGAQAVANLKAKLGDPQFRADLIPLLRYAETQYDIDDAAELVITELLARVDEGKDLR